MTALDPRVVAATAEQLAQWRADLQAGGERVGWKSGLNIAEVQERLGLREPVIGHLLSSTLLESGESFSASDSTALRAEAEIALEVGPDVDGAATADEAREAILGFGVAIELVDVGRPPADLEGIVAANVFHRAFVLGPSRPAVADGIEAQLTVGGELCGSAPIPDDFAETVLVVARLLGAVGERLRAGDRILAGALVHVPVETGQIVRTEAGPLGAVEVAIA